MDNYNFREDLLDTYQSMEPMMQLAWLVVPLVFLLALIMVFLHHLRHRPHAMDQPPPPVPPAMLYDQWHEYPQEDLNQILIDRHKHHMKK